MIVFQSDYGLETEKEYLETAGIEIKEYAPVTRNVYISGFHAGDEDSSSVFCETAISMTGTKESPVCDIHFNDMQVLRPDTFLDVAYADGITLENAVITKNRKKDIFKECSDITFKNVTYKKTRQSVREDYESIDNFESENLVFESTQK